METQAVFENIAQRIQQEIERAQSSIFIAVAWFTNQSLFNELVRKAHSGCRISLIVSNDEINANSSIDFNKLNIGRSKVFMIGDGKAELMHNKFCVIDHNLVITGSYNWSYKAENNFENIVLTYDDTALAEQFIIEFNNIRKQYYPELDPANLDFPLLKVIKRLEILKNYIMLEDVDEFQKETTKLKEYDFNSDLNEIIRFVSSGELAEALERIEKFISRNQQITTWTDPEIAALKLEIKILENQLVSFDNEKSELEGVLRDFQREHFLAVGDLILKLLQFRKIKYSNDKDKFEEAEKDEKEYREQFEFEKEKDVNILSEDEKKELTSAYRKAAILCHPDKFSQAPVEIQKQAEEMMIELSIAKDKKDLQRVKEILSDLENGIISSRKSDDNSDKLKLKNLVTKLRKKIKKLEDEIINIKLSDEFKLIREIEDWGVYFANVKERLINELDALEEEVN
jgi:hypothetical protein